MWELLTHSCGLDYDGESCKLVTVLCNIHKPIFAQIISTLFPKLDFTNIKSFEYM